MRTRLIFGLIAVAVWATIPSIAGGASTPSMSFSPASLKGTWVWAFEGRLVRYQYAQLGLAKFDGKGGCTITLMENSGANGGYDHASNRCTYEVAKNGLGSIDYALDGEAGAATIAIGPKDIRMTSSDPGNTGDGVLRRASLVSASELVGRWTFSMEGTIFGEKLSGAGVMTFNGSGKCSQSLAYNYGVGEQQVTTDSCTYELGETGIGFADIAYSNGTGGDSYFLTADGMKDLFLLTTAEGEVLYGHGIKS
ncbi:MAG: hypothetical protein ACLGIB_00615 [Actinomycetota bacterium]